MLPKQEGGLDMPDIDNIITTRRVKFTLDSISEPCEKWNFIAQYCFKYFDKSYCLKYFLLNVTDSERFLDKNMPTFYKNCIVHFQKYLRAIDVKNKDRNYILNEIIWHNHQIRFKYQEECLL